MKVFICALLLPGVLLAEDSSGGEVIEDKHPTPIEIIEDKYPRPIEIIEDKHPTPIEIASDQESRIEKRSANGYIRPCYFTNWARYRQGRAKYFPKEYIPGLCTHMLFAFGWMNEDFTVRAYDLQDLDTDWAVGLFRQVNDLKKQDPQLKTLLSIGGWTFGTRLFKAMAKEAATRQTFIRSATEFVREHNFDGLDIDWEYPQGPDDMENYSKLIKETREAFEAEALQMNKERLLITAAVSAGEGTIENAYDVPEISKYFDFILLMAYDFHGAWEGVTGVNAPLYSRKEDIAWQKVWNIDWAANNWYEKGMPKDKIIVGIATYGRGWTLKDASDNAIGAASTDSKASKATKYVGEKGTAAYFELCEMIADGATRVWDEESQTPYLYHGDQWFSYDDEESVRAKMAWLKKNGYGGAFVWTLDFDDFNGQCSNGNGKKYPLISIIGEELSNKDMGPTPKTTTPKPDPENPNPCKGENDGFYRHPRSCTEFLLCLSGGHHVMSCPDGFEFSSTLRYCAPPSMAGCRGTSVATTPTPPETKAPTTTKPPTQKPAPKPKTTTTPRPTTTPPAGGNKPFTCPGDGFHPDPTSCAHFYRCVSRTPYRFSCPGGLHFDKDSSVCANAQVAKCSSA